MQRDVPLAPFTTFRIGGKARFFIRAETEDEVAGAFEFANSRGIDLFVMGGGSNVLVSDAGFDGLVLQIAVTGAIVEEAGRVTACAGEDWDKFVSLCVDRDLAGIECLSGIPGSVGGTPVQNVGAYGQEVAETIESVRCFDRETREFVTLANGDCGFEYRTSIFNSTRRERYIVLSVNFALKHRAGPKIAYKDLIDRFGDTRPSLIEVREAILSIRRSKSMVIDKGDPNSRSAGSFFKNPVVERGKLDEISAFHDNVPHFEFGDGVKIPAAWLIDKAGFKKGFALGNAGISTKHNLAIVNLGGASAADILCLEQMIRDAVEAKFGIILIREPVLVGF